MTDYPSSPPYPHDPTAGPGAPLPQYYGQTAPPPAGYGGYGQAQLPPSGYDPAPRLPTGYGMAPGPIGQVRGTGMVIGLFIVTLGFYGWYWWFVTHEEMKRHSGQGLGGTVALLLAIFVGVVMPFLTSNEVGELYTRRGQRRPVSAATGLWVFPGSLLIVLPLVWIIQTNNALNDYWRSLGATG